MEKNNINRDWTQAEFDFYIASAKAGLSKKDALIKAKAIGFPKRTVGGLNMKLLNADIVWTKIGGANGKGTKVELNVPTIKVSEQVGIAKKELLQKQEIQSLKNQNKYLMNQVITLENWQADLQRGMVKLPANIIKPTLGIGKNKTENKITETMIMAISDLHVGERVRPEDTLGFGSYDFDMFQRRMESYVDTVELFTKSILTNYYYRKLNIFCLGDMITGLIHQELGAFQPQSIMDAIVSCVIVMERVILDLTDLFPEIEVDCVVGNHGRFTKEVTFKKKGINNFDYVCYKMLEDRFKDIKRVKFNIAESPYLLIDIEGWKWFLSHGDNIRSWQGMPLYGIQRELKKWGDLFGVQDKAFDYAMLGHFHTAFQIARPGRGKVFGNGCVIGPTEYGMSLSMDPVEPSQWLLGIHPEVGLTLQVDVQLQNPPIKKEYRYQFNPEKN